MIWLAVVMCLPVFVVGVFVGIRMANKATARIIDKTFEIGRKP